MRLFHDGLREAAMPPLTAVLGNPDGPPEFRIAAAGLLAETYRGRADFLRAERYFRTALAEADTIPPGQRPHNEWYLHYRPRCALGLITALRRLISPDHRTIETELRDTRDLARHLTIEDLTWQLAAVDAVYRRQRGDLDGAVGLLRDARDAMAGLTGFCFWYPEHVAALLLQVQLLTRSGRALVRRGARTLLGDASVRSWSKAVAAACCLHLTLDRLLERGASTAEFAAAARDDSPDGAGGILEVLEACARDERDPLLDSEWLVLRLAWRRAAGQTGDAAQTAGALLDIARRAPPILGVLRGCEMRLIIARSPAAAVEHAAVAALADHASRTLGDLGPSIASYGYGADTVAEWARILATPGASPHGGWLDGPLSALRCLAWP
ncbi:MAG: hypothetical protein E6J90_45610 [Deltaproteobacteria bacterium]|nr:MAG: hypothetical protein E6J91_52265 [Deltaproteobacteria bacterium]TMQ06620.1 MAG: hypothetical protein E6J90_45610 [Deltaproteobacteria bacterium]